MTRQNILRAALLVAVLAALLVLGRRAGGAVLAFSAWVESLGPWGAAAFIAGYALATVALVPGSLLTVAAGTLFGFGRGVLYVFAAAVLGSTAAFLVARHLARPAVERRLAGDARVAAIERAVERQGGRIVFLLRLSPVVPFNLLNYALGLTPVRLRDYLLAAPGMLPGTVLYVYSGTLLGGLAGLAGGAPVRRDAAYWAVLAAGLVATLLVTALVTRLARRALREATRESANDHAAAGS